MLKDGTMGSFETRTLNSLDHQIKEMTNFAAQGDVSSMAKVAKDMASEFNRLGKNDPLHQALTKQNADVYENIAAKLKAKSMPPATVQVCGANSGY